MAQKYSAIIKELGKDRVKRNEPLSAHTTFGIGGPADLFYEGKTTDELAGAIKLARKLKISYFILGGGSDLLVSDAGFRGLAIRVKTSDCRVKNGLLSAEAGTPTAYVLNTALKNDLTGLEFLSGIPGTIGGAVVCNARAHFLGDFFKKPLSIGDAVTRIEILTPDGEIKKFPGKHYPHTLSSSSIRESGDIILSVEFKLKKGVSKKARQYIKDYKEFRKDQPYQKYPTPGSIFQNPPGKAAGWLINQCGLKGKQKGDAQISSKHANFIVNLGKAKASDVVQLIKLAKKEVFKKFGIRLKEEICLIGFDKSRLTR